MAWHIDCNGQIVFLSEIRSMKIENQSAVNSTAASRRTTSAQSAATFQQAMAQATTQRDTQSTSSSQKTTSTTPTAPTKSARDELFEFLKKSPEQRLREKILREMGLTEDQLAALPPEEREKVEKEITERIRQQLFANQA